MKVGELLIRLQEQTMREVCDDLGVHTSTIQRKLKKLGYEWDNSAKLWFWDHEEDQPLETEVMDLVTKKGPAAAKVNVLVNDNDHIDDVVMNDAIDQILRNDNKNVKVQKGIYFEPDVARALDRLVKKKKQSELVNAAVRQVLKAKGML